MVATHESAVLARCLIADTLEKEGIGPGQLTVHAERGTSMRSKPVALPLADLGVEKTNSRPHVSNDNPYSESQFRTLKYRPTFPDRFVGMIMSTGPTVIRRVPVNVATRTVVRGV
jgi:putative transposase